MIDIDIIYGMDKYLHCWATPAKSCNDCEDIRCWLSIVVSAAKSTVVMMATIKKVKRMNIVIYFIQ